MHTATTRGAARIRWLPTICDLAHPDVSIRHDIGCSSSQFYSLAKAPSLSDQENHLFSDASRSDLIPVSQRVLARYRWTVEQNPYICHSRSSWSASRLTEAGDLAPRIFTKREPDARRLVARRAGGCALPLSLRENVALHVGLLSGGL